MFDELQNHFSSFFIRFKFVVNDHWNCGGFGQGIVFFIFFEKDKHPTSCFHLLVWAHNRSHVVFSRNFYRLTWPESVDSPHLLYIYFLQSISLVSCISFSRNTWHRREENGRACTRRAVLPPREAHVQPGPDEAPEAEDDSLGAHGLQHRRRRSRLRRHLPTEEDRLCVIVSECRKQQRISMFLARRCRSHSILFALFTFSCNLKFDERMLYHVICRLWPR